MNNAVTSAGHKYYLITEQQIEVLKHNAIHITNYEIATGVIIGVLLSFTILAWLRGGIYKEIIQFLLIGGAALIMWFLCLNQGTRSMSDKIWQDIQQTSEDISEKKQKKGTP
ncbi:hypothetical protein ME1_00800 [Bartonella vinsonii subsp. arupensis OK-94-513]|uniref:Uncharacterized protein n=2 Tax=Bartonella vinsonii subsp. arupensis TaxID=110578 RepID=J0ZIR0_BARVI|nr:hypothetical protein [Bartonella vinsonii]EJF88113.1 hypothetical protein ME1_00800 [Bartonella vinsonii subsp. arupensis OK-94-513]EJF96881.1 hypothetical protein MEI_01493 [Bartonella vinsonii subsp. arupensis Pm136co]